MMRTLLIARRELAAYLRTFQGYIIIAMVLAVDGLLFNAYALGGVSTGSLWWRRMVWHRGVGGWWQSDGVAGERATWL